MSPKFPTKIMRNLKGGKGGGARVGLMKKTMAVNMLVYGGNSLVVAVVVVVALVALVAMVAMVVVVVVTVWRW